MNEYENFINQRFNYKASLKRPITLCDLKSLYEYLNKEIQTFIDYEPYIPVEVKTAGECEQYQEILQDLIDITAGAKIQCEYLFSQACNRERIFYFCDCL